jgi:sec-independent protein translocase protein TatA
MFTKLGLPEILLILAIVVLLFGVGRIGKIGKELGGGIRSFKEGLQGKDENKPAEEEKPEEKKE